MQKQCKSYRGVDELDFDLTTNRSDLSAYISSIESIRLKETDDYVLGRIIKVDIIEDMIYLIDNPGAKLDKTTIYKFDKQGNPVGKFKNIGVGPNEYIEIFDFDINEKQKEITLLCVPPKLITLDMDLNIKKELILEQFYTQIASSDSVIFLYSYHASCLDKLENGTISNVMTFKEPSMGIVNTPGSDFSFFRNDNSVYFQPYLDNEIYHISNGYIKLFKNIYYENQIKSAAFYKNTYVLDITIEDRGKYFLPQINYMFEVDKGLRIGYVWGFEHKMFFANNDGTSINYTNGFLRGNISPVSRNGYLFAGLDIDHYDFDAEYTIESHKGIDFKNKLSKAELQEKDNNNPIILLYKLK